MTRAYTNMDSVAVELAQHLQALRDAIDPQDGTPIDTSLCSVESFCATALRVMQKTNPSKVRSCAMTVEIKARMDGIPVLRGYLYGHRDARHAAAELALSQDAELLALRKDAQRYRWLRDDHRGRSMSVSALDWTGVTRSADAAVDAAMLDAPAGSAA